MDEKEIIVALKQMKKESKLGKSLPQVIQWMNQLSSTSSIEKAGYILRDMCYEDWAEAEKIGLTPIKIAVIGNFTSDSIDRYLRAMLIQEGIWQEFYVAPYNQYVYELIDENSNLFRFQPDITFCLLDEVLVFEECRKDDWTIADVKQSTKNKLRELKQLIETFQRYCNGVFVTNTIPFPQDQHASIIDYKSKANLSKEWRLFEAKLLKLSDHYKQVVTLDLSILMQDISLYRDPRFMHYASMSMSDEMLAAIAKEGLKLSRSLLGLNKKCLALDLDDTLWGGIAGDDGLNGIQLGGTPPGKAFVDFQNKLKMLQRQGVLLAVNSKNEASNVQEIFEKHPDMVLKQNDFVTIHANWDAKHENLKRIASQLNIGLDSFVFVDDNPFERNLIREFLTNVAVPEMPKEPFYYTGTLLSQGWFNCIELTKEDSNRTDKYKQIVKRREFQNSTASIEEYLHGLDIHVSLLNPTEENLPRLHQLNMRTNQFNLTTRRYTQSVIQDSAEHDDYFIFGFQATDRFGDNGIVGSVYIEKVRNHDREEWWIRNFIMSCRVFSRGIETSVLQWILHLAKKSAVSAVYGEYIPSKKNGYVQNFYQDHGFEMVRKERDYVMYCHSLDNISAKPDWIALHPMKEVLTI
ncbi:HAD-IIIC family phosphatase [Lentibacillus cibarius]|nr:HAD-IIIC family phosphatase [Lentibacillus cibarius]